MNLSKYKQEPVFWIGMLMTAIGSAAIFIGEVSQAMGKYAVPGALLSLRAFLLIAGADLRSRGRSKEANLWTLIASLTALIYCALIFWGRWLEPVHVGLQSLNLLLIGVELYVGMLRATPVAILKARAALANTERILARTRTWALAIAQDRREIKAKAAKNEKLSRAALLDSDSVLEDLRTQLAKEKQKFAELAASASPALALYAKVKAAGVQTFRNGRWIAVNGPALLEGATWEEAVCAADSESRIATKRAAYEKQNQNI